MTLTTKHGPGLLLQQIRPWLRRKRLSKTGLTKPTSTQFTGLTPKVDVQGTRWQNRKAEGSHPWHQ